MTDDQKRLLAVFEVRTRDLMALCDRQKQEIQELTNALNSKEDELQQAIRTISELEAKYDSLLTARIVSVKEKEVKSAKMRLSKLMREVDKCIALLNG
jgi:chromosome segregation ATPase